MKFFLARKYKILDATREIDGHILHQIQRRNGDLGGFIESENNLSQTGTCWVSENASVYGKAKVIENAQVYGDAIVGGEATISGNAQVFGNAKVDGYSKIEGDAKVYGSAVIHDSSVFDEAQVFDSAELSSHSCIENSAKIYERAKVECANVRGGASVYEDAHIDVRSIIFGTAKVYGNAYVKCSTVSDRAEVYGNAQILGASDIGGLVQVFDNAVVKNEGCIFGKQTICGQAVIQRIFLGEDAPERTYTSDIEPEMIGNRIKYFCMYIENHSNKLQIQPSVEEFFTHQDDGQIVISTIDTKNPIMTFERQSDVYTYLVDVRGDNEAHRSSYTFTERDEVYKQLKLTIDTLQNSQQYSKYADDLDASWRYVNYK